MTGEFVHRLGITVGGLTILLCAAVVIMQARRRRKARRRAALMVCLGGKRRFGSGRRWRRWRERGLRDAPRGWLPPTTALLAGTVLVGGVRGCLLGLAAAFGLGWWHRRRRVRQGAEPAAEPAVTPQLPLAADLLAACLAAGAGPREAAEAVGASFRGRLGRCLTRASAELRLGGEPADAWGRVGALPGAARLASCLERAGTTGVPAVEAVSRLAADCRSDQQRAAGARAGRAQVLTTAPLGLCFLPAFLLMGVVPMVIGLSGGMAHAH
ncbi:hypothetical protein ACZ90_27015 [Streptomyces albus subsp. albus]|nr:hypothetical protein ACZ90_27015 [Streptomyces albus subsp. albus]